MLPDKTRNILHRQLIQNFVLFAGILFAHRWFDGASLFMVLAAYAVLGVLTYIMLFTVSLVETEKGSWDFIFFTLHGKFPRWMPWLFWGLIAVSFLRPLFGVMVVLYLVIGIAHELFLTHQVIWDVVTLSTGFTIRAMAGVYVLYDVSLSPWLVICTFLLAMIVALGKRKNDLVRQAESETANHHADKGYSEQLIDQMLAVVTSSTLLTYMLYSISERTTHQVVGSTGLLYTTPFVLYGIMRYLYLIQRDDFTDGSEMAVLRDLPILLDIVLWIAAVIFVLAG